jgi:hypothetical protein
MKVSMRWLTALYLPLLLLVGPIRTGSAEEARPVFLKWAELLGVCGGRLLFYGHDKPRVESGLYSTDGRRATLLSDFYDGLRARIRNPGISSEQTPQLLGPMPLGHFLNGVQSFLTACATPQSVKVIKRNFYPEFGSNSIVRENQLIFGEVYRRRTELFRLANNKLITLGAAPSKRPEEDEEGPTFVYNTEKSVVFTVNDVRTALPTLWRTVKGGVEQLVNLDELSMGTLTDRHVGDGLETGSGKLAFTVSGTEPTGRRQSSYYVTDGESVQSLSLPPFNDVREHYTITFQDGVLALILDGSRQTPRCQLKLFSFLSGSSQDITSALGAMPTERPWCLDFAAQTSGDSLFFVHPDDPKKLLRLELTTLTLTPITTADGAIRGLWSFRNRLYFRVRDKPHFDKIYVTDGTTAGTSQITVKGRALRGVDMSAAVFYRNEVYVTGFTRTIGDSILDFGIYRF